MGPAEQPREEGAPRAAPDVIDVCRRELAEWGGDNDRLIEEVAGWMICRLGAGDHGHTMCWLGTLVIGALAGPALPERSIWDDVV